MQELKGRSLHGTIENGMMMIIRWFRPSKEKTQKTVPEIEFSTVAKKLRPKNFETLKLKD
jgi:hypothetical protein